MCLFKKNTSENLKTNITNTAYNLSNPEDLLIEKYGKTKNTLDTTAIVNGKVCFDTSIRIEGKLNGEMNAKRLVIVGKSGVVNAQIKAEQVIVLGVVKGDIEVSKGIEILVGGYVEGSIITPSITIETGAKFNGNCTMKFTEIITEESNEINPQTQDELNFENIVEEETDIENNAEFSGKELFPH